MRRSQFVFVVAILLFVWAVCAALMFARYGLDAWTWFRWSLAALCLWFALGVSMGRAVAIAQRLIGKSQWRKH